MSKIIQGKEVNPACPRCGGLAIYNGDYFCADRTFCRWVFPDSRLDGSFLLSTMQLAYWGLQAYRSIIPLEERNPNIDTIAAWIEIIKEEENTIE